MHKVFSYSFSVGPVILTIPSYFTFTIKPHQYFYNETVGANDVELQNAMKTNYTDYWKTDNNTWLMLKNSTQYYMYYSDYAHEDGKPGFLFSLTIWLYSFMLKLIPSIILTIFTGFLIVELYKAEERSARLKNGGPNGAMAAPSNRTPQVRYEFLIYIMAILVVEFEVRNLTLIGTVHY